MQDTVCLDRAFACAGRSEPGPLRSPIPALSKGSQSLVDGEDKPPNGGGVRICTDCIQRKQKVLLGSSESNPLPAAVYFRHEELLSDLHHHSQTRLDRNTSLTYSRVCRRGVEDLQEMTLEYEKESS